jgi:hypothetical protein
MKRIVIDVQDADHARIKKLAQAQGQTVANLFRAFVGIPPERQGERKDLNNKHLRKKSKANANSY